VRNVTGLGPVSNNLPRALQVGVYLIFWSVRQVERMRVSQKQYVDTALQVGYGLDLERASI